VPLTRLLLAGPEVKVDTIAEIDSPSSVTTDEASDAASAFERYDLLSVAVVDARGKLVGRLTGDAIIDFLRSEAQRQALAAVMTLAVLLNLLVAAAVGVAVPLGLQRAGRDPAQGASVLLTFVTDSMGFFLFLGLATAFLV
jgi:Mg/Co/Ni transporter MgtE